MPTPPGSPPAPFGPLQDEYFNRIVRERDKTFDMLLVFFDWRHKVMVRFFVVTATVVVGWYYLPPDRWELQAALLAVGALVATAMAAMDSVNAGHLLRLYERGAAWEGLLYDSPGVFATIRFDQNDAALARRGHLEFDRPQGKWRQVFKAWPVLGKRLQAPGRRLKYGRIVNVVYLSAAGGFLFGAIATLIHHR